MTLTIIPSQLKGSITPPPSKSQAHRCLIAAALAGEGSEVRNLADSEDIRATRRCLEEIGPWTGPMSPLRRMAYPRLDCGESGSTLRFLIPIALAVRGGGVFTGHGRLMERPQKPYFDIFKEKGIFYEQRDGVLTVQGMLSPGKYTLPGNVSSQFITGLLYALPLLEGDSYIYPTTPIESWDYILMTMDVLFQAGIVAEEPREGVPYFYIHGGQSYRPHTFTVEPDWSQAGFWFAAGALGNRVEVEGMKLPSMQGDCRYLEMQEKIYSTPAGAKAEVDVSQNPDLVPPLAAAAALAEGRQTRLTNAARLRLKESDRLRSVTAVLSALGADIEEGEDFLLIRGKDALAGGVTVDSFNDHRIAMMTAVAASRCEKPVTLTGAESVNKSYPSFWEEYARLGGKMKR